MKAFVIIGSLCLSIFGLSVYFAHVQYTNTLATGIPATGNQTAGATTHNAAEPTEIANMHPEADGAQFHAGPDVYRPLVQGVEPKTGSLVYETFELPQGAGLGARRAHPHVLPDVAPEWKDPSFADYRQANVGDLQAPSNEVAAHHCVINAKPDQIDEDLLILEAHSEDRLAASRRR